MTRIMREYDRPIINIEHTEYGMRLITLRKIDGEKTHVRVTNAIFPHTFVIPLSETMTITQMHIPVDDTNTYWYSVFTSFDQPVDKEAMRNQRLRFISLPDYIPNLADTTTGATTPKNKTPAPTLAWVKKTSTCTTNGPAKAWAPLPTARANIWARATRPSSPIGAC